MKCLICGCERDFVEVALANALILSDSGNYEQIVKSYACVECGFVQMFAKEQVKEKLAEIEKQKEHARYLAERNAKINDINEKIKEIERIINDENQTVKAVKEAKERLIELREELSNVQHSNINYF